MTRKDILRGASPSTDSPDRKRLLSRTPGCPDSEDIPVECFDPARENGISVPVPVRTADPEFEAGVFRDLGCPGVPGSPFYMTV